MTPTRQRPTTTVMIGCVVTLVLGCVAIATWLRITPTASGDARPDPHRQIKQDYHAYWDALLQASATSDPDFPALADRAAGRQLAQLRSSLAEDRRNGVIAKGNVKHNLRQVDMTGQTAHLVDCVDVRSWLRYDTATGLLRTNQLMDRPGQLGRFVLAIRDGHWLVTDIESLGTC